MKDTVNDGGEDFAALFEASQKNAPRRGRRPTVGTGDLVRGRITSMGRDSAFVALFDGQAEGMIEIEQLRDGTGKLVADVGDEIEARVVETDDKAGCIILRRTAVMKGAEAKAELERAAAMGLPVEGTVTAVNKGGVDVAVGGVRGFCPISQLDGRPVDDASRFVGQKLTFRITKLEADRRGLNLVLSRRVLLEEEARTRADQIRDKLVPGAVMDGRVVALKDFGAFVDLGGIEGLLPVSELSFSRTEKPSDLLTLGQEVRVQILKVEKTDDAKRPLKLTLSLKALADDPWDTATATLSPGVKVKGTVMRTESFGAFVQVAPGVEGLLHISELAGGRQARHARELTKPGDTHEVTVLAVDREKRRISLGIGDRPDAVDPADLAAARSAAPQRLGTLGDLLKLKKG